MNKLVELFCDVDDFCQIFIPLWEQQCLENGTRRRRRSCRMSPSEIMTILIAFHMSNHRISRASIWVSLECTTVRISGAPQLYPFLGVMSSVMVPLCSYFTSLRGKPTGIEFIDSTSIKVCHNIRIPRHKVFDGVARRGKGTMGWFTVSNYTLSSTI